jgi:hypothetical protein
VAVEDIDDTEPAEPAWIVIDSDDLLDLLRKVKDGEDPEMVMLEMYVNSEVHDCDEEDFGDIF